MRNSGGFVKFHRETYGTSLHKFATRDGRLRACFPAVRSCLLSSCPRLRPQDHRDLRRAKHRSKSSEVSTTFGTLE